MTPEQEARLTVLDYQLEHLFCGCTDGLDVDNALERLDANLTLARLIKPECAGRNAQHANPAHLRSYHAHVAAALGYSVLLKDALAERHAFEHIVWLPAEVIW